jgi:hypothetical protein
MLDFIKVNKEEEKRLYRICKELEFNGESLIVDAKGSSWQSTMRKFGVRAKPLIEKDLLEPIWVQRKPGNYIMENKLIRTKNSKVKEVNKGKNSLFVFESIKLDDSIHKKRRRLL